MRLKRGVQRDGAPLPQSQADDGPLPARLRLGLGRRDDLFNTNASIVKSIAEQCAKSCPKACFLIISNPVNSTVPIFGEVLKVSEVARPCATEGLGGGLEEASPREASLLQRLPMASRVRSRVETHEETHVPDRTARLDEAV